MSSVTSAADSQEVLVRLRFAGTAVIQVPAGLTSEQARLLAEKLAVAAASATFDNLEDCEECLERACDEFGQKSGMDEDTAERVFDAARPVSLGGVWNVALE